MSYSCQQHRLLPKALLVALRSVAYSEYSPGPTILVISILVISIFSGWRG